MENRSLTFMNKCAQLFGSHFLLLFKPKKKHEMSHLYFKCWQFNLLTQININPFLNVFYLYVRFRNQIFFSVHLLGALQNMCEIKNGLNLKAAIKSIKRAIKKINK